jgi:hypothetical protein
MLTPDLSVNPDATRSALRADAGSPLTFVRYAAIRKVTPEIGRFETFERDD